MGAWCTPPQWQSWQQPMPPQSLVTSHYYWPHASWPIWVGGRRAMRGAPSDPRQCHGHESPSIQTSLSTQKSCSRQASRGPSEACHAPCRKLVNGQATPVPSECQSGSKLAIPDSAHAASVETCWPACHSPLASTRGAAPQPLWLTCRMRQRVQPRQMAKAPCATCTGGCMGRRMASKPRRRMRH